MIQRPQSICLLGVLICMVLMLFNPIWQESSKEKSERVQLSAFELSHERTGTDSKTIQEKNVAYLAGLAIVAAAIALFSIFQFKKRLLQIKLGAANSLLLAGVLVLAVLLAKEADPLLTSEVPGSYKIGMFLPGIAVVLNIISNRLIRRDEMLVKSVDRLR